MSFECSCGLDLSRPENHTKERCHKNAEWMKCNSCGAKEIMLTNLNYGAKEIFEQVARETKEAK